jgi:putative ubiquitin-RnfH superfamily antitoxin RatB of RatAB toxin-antitoxin module
MATRQRKKKVIKSDFIPAGVTPFDTGKVKMGINYQKPKYIEYDSDMLEIQKWLISDPEKLRREYWINCFYMAALMFVLTVLILRGIMAP